MLCKYLIKNVQQFAGIIVTTVGSSTPLSNRQVQNTLASQTSSNVTPKQGSVVFIKKGNKIDLLHGPNGGSPPKKQRVIVPKITKPHLVSGRSLMTSPIWVLWRVSKAKKIGILWGSKYWKHLKLDFLMSELWIVPTYHVTCIKTSLECAGSEC